MYTSWESARGAWPSPPVRRRRDPQSLAAGEARGAALRDREIRVNRRRRDRGHGFLAPRPSQSSRRRRQLFGHDAAEGEQEEERARGRRRRGPHEYGKREAHGKRDAPGGPGALRCNVVDTFVASWGHRAQAMHCHYGCTLQFEHFGVMQRFRRPGLGAAWCSVQRVTVLSVAQKMAALLVRVRLRTR